MINEYVVAFFLRFLSGGNSPLLEVDNHAHLDVVLELLRKE